MYQKCIILYVNLKGGKLTLRVARVPLRKNVSTIKHPFQLILFIKVFLYTCLVEICTEISEFFYCLNEKFALSHYKYKN